MPNDDRLNVFAYGSNLHSRRMLARVSTASPVAIGYVEGRQLRFHKRSVDGSAKADAALSPDADDCVWGVVYRLAQDEKRALDRFEFLGIGYDEELVAIETQNGSIDAWIYVARKESVDDTLKPYSWYCDYVIAGARQHRLPFCYIGKLLKVATTTDPDLSRRERNRKRIYE